MQKKHKYIALIVFISIWFGIAVFSGSVFSGYHLTDDHEIVRIKKDLSSQTTMQVAGKWMRRDQFSTHRFRPFYFLHRVIETRIFGSNFVIWSVYTIILAIATSFLLFYFLSLVGFSFWESFLFSEISLIGPQAQIWWRLGPNETIGMFMLAVSLLFLGLYYNSQKNERILKILFIIFSILMALSKESFILILPAFILILTYLSKMKNQISWKKVFQENYISISILMGVFIGFLLYIKNLIGMAGIGYAGINGFQPEKYIKTFLNLSTKSWIDYLIFIQLILIILFIFLKGLSKQNIWKIVRKYLLVTTIFLAIVIPQVILYTKSGFNKRYLLPSMLGYSFIFVYLLKQMRKKTLIIWSGIVFVSLFFLLGNLRSDFKNAQEFTQRGKAINGVFNIIKIKTSPTDNILIVGDPIMYYEWSDSINYYLKNELSRKNLFIYPLFRKKLSSYSVFGRNLIKGFGKIYGKNRYENIKNESIIDTIVLFPRMEKTFLKNFSDIGLLKSDFTEKSSGRYVIYYKNK